MLKQIANILTAALITAGASSLTAQVSKQIEVAVPFDFTVGSKIYKAGAYRLLEDMPSLVKFRNTATNVSAFVMTSSVIEQGRKKQGKPTLVFNRYGDKYFLSQIWHGENGVGRQLKKSPAEREQLARTAAPTTVEVASSTRTR